MDILFVISIILILIFRVTIVDGDSMNPTLKDKQIVFCNVLDKTPEIGDIVVVDASSIIAEDVTIIKRVVGIDKERNTIFLVGDNREHSTDSRDFGWVSTSKIIGVIV